MKGIMDKIKYKNRLLKCRYNITLHDYEVMLKSQKNRCKICNVKFKNSKDTHVDHCHETNEVRGLLCPTCNRSLGHYEKWFKKYKDKIKEYLK